jgi:hypothetical protein
MRKHILEMDEEQAIIIEWALDLFSRVHMGQWAELATWANVSPDEVVECGEVLDETAVAFGVRPERNSFYGITSNEIHDRARVAWDIQQVVRHCVAWERNPEGGFTVEFDSPLCVSGKQLPEMRKKPAPLEGIPKGKFPC